MKRILNLYQLKLTHQSYVALSLVMFSLLLIITTVSPFTLGKPVVYAPVEIVEPTSTTPMPQHYPIRYQNFTMEGEADLTAFVVNPDGSMTSTMLAAGDVGDYTTSSEPYSDCLLALAIFRWGDYQGVFDGLLALITNDTSGGGTSGFDELLAILDLLPPNAILMIFMTDNPSLTQPWGHAIHLEFESTLNTPFERVFGLSLPISNVSVGIEAYGFYGVLGMGPVDIQGRDQFQSYMYNLGQTRRGGTELVTPALAEDTTGGVGITGFINMAALTSSPSPMKSSLQLSDALTIAAWGGQHQDKFYGSAVQTFNVNEFCDRTGTISLGTLDAFEFTMLFPPGVNITSYVPTDMINSTSPEGAMVARSTGHWLNDSEVANIIVNFQGDFPPGLIITKSITSPIVVGGTATVTIELTNIDPLETVQNVTLDDSGSWVAYQGYSHSRLVVSGDMTANFATIGPGGTETHTYTIAVFGEGSYVAQRANVTFEDDLSRSWTKSSNKVVLRVVYASIFDFILAILRDIPWSLPVLILIILMTIYAIIWLIKSLLGLVSRRKGAPLPPPTSAQLPESKAILDEDLLPPPPDEFDMPAKPYSESTCINCGSPIPSGVSFCPACGTKVADQ